MRLHLSTRQSSLKRGPILILSALMLAVTCASAIAAPLTLKFEATIGPPRQGGNGDFELPFSFSEGDAISGSFTFEPLDVAPEVYQTFTVQPFPLEVVIEDFSLTTSGYSVDVRAPLAFIDLPEPIDVIWLNGDGLNEVDGTGGTEFSLAFSFFGDQGLLTGADIPGDSATWSGFDFQNSSSLLVTFRHLTGQQYEYRGFQAYITSVHLVPEPPANYLLLGALTIIGINLASRTKAFYKFHGGKLCSTGSAVKAGPREIPATAD